MVGLAGLFVQVVSVMQPGHWASDEKTGRKILISNSIFRIIENDIGCAKLNSISQ